MSRAVPVVLATVVLVSGCASGRAQMPRVSPTLETPLPPTRVIIPEPLVYEEPPPPPPPAVTPPAEPVRNPQTPAPRPNDKPPVSAPPPTPTPETAPPVLQTSTNATASERNTLTKLALAQKDLDSVQYLLLGPDAKEQYDRASGLMRLARQALGIKNYLAAEELANKAAALASQLRKAASGPTSA